MPKKLKGKEWYTLISPKVFGEKEIGETPASDPKILLGRRVDVHLINLINDLSKYYIKFFFRVSDVKEDKAYTQFDGIECLRDYISRLIRYGIRRIDTNQVLTTSDKVKLRVKSIIITSKKIKRKVELILKKYVEEKIRENIEKNKLDDFIKAIVSDTLKNSVIREGGKIYPIRAFEIRKVERLA